MINLEARPQLSATWVQETVDFIWGFQLLPWQLQDVMSLLGGGIFGVMYPTDHGKSMEIEMVAVLGLILRPQRRKIVIKINQSAADECCEELAIRLEKASTRYSYVRPLVSWRNGVPYGISEGFWIAGCERSKDAQGRPGRDINPSVRCYGLGSRDLQGKRGDTQIDDIETQEEADSAVMQRRLKNRLAAVLRTLVDDIHALWAAFGTPYHENSVYFNLTEMLQDSGINFRSIFRPLRNPDGTLLWPERARKVEIHRRTMTKSEYATAYELKPMATRRYLTPEQILAMREPELGPCLVEPGRALPEEQFRTWLFQAVLSHRPEYRDTQTWRQEMQETIARLLEIYVNWDPAAPGDWGISVTPVLGRRMWIMRATLGTGDSFHQAEVVRDHLLQWPNAVVVMEANATQVSFAEILQRVHPPAPIILHDTKRNKTDPLIGLPVFAREVQAGRVQLPGRDEGYLELEFADLLDELKRWGPSSHPHLLMSTWFGWHYAHAYEFQAQVRNTPRPEPLPMPTITSSPLELAPQSVQILDPLAPRMRRDVNPVLRQRAREAWGRRHQR